MLSKCKSFKIAIPFNRLRIDKQEDITLYKEILKHQHYVRYINTKYGPYILFESALFTESDKWNLQIILNSLCRRVGYNALVQTYVLCQNKLFKLSHRIFYVNINNNDELQNEIICTNKEKYQITVEHIQFSSPYTAIDSCFADLYLISDQEIQQMLIAVDTIHNSRVLATVKCKDCSIERVICSILCGENTDFYLVKDGQLNVDSDTEAVDSDNSVECNDDDIDDNKMDADDIDDIDYEMKEDNVSGDLLSVSNVSHISFVERVESKESSLNISEPSISEPPISGPPSTSTTHGWGYLLNANKQRTIKYAKKQWKKNYGHKAIHNTPHNKHCVVCHSLLLTGREVGIFCKVCHWAICLYCGVGTKHDLKRVCYGCRARRDMRDLKLTINDLKDPNKYINHQRYSPFYIEKGFIYICNAADDKQNKSIYYFQPISDTSPDDLRNFIYDCGMNTNEQQRRKITKKKEYLFMGKRRIKHTKHYRGNIQDDNHEITVDVFQYLLNTGEKTAFSSHYNHTHNDITTSTDELIQLSNDKTKARDSIWGGVMPAGTKYSESRKSSVPMDYSEIPEMVKIEYKLFTND